MELICISSTFVYTWSIFNSVERNFILEQFYLQLRNR